MRTFLGAALGGVLGFLFRPSVPLVGQLPFEIVLTRGENLRGLDVILKSVAQQSFNHIVIGILIGAVAGYMITSISPGRQARKGD